MGNSSISFEGGGISVDSLTSLVDDLLWLFLRYLTAIAAANIAKLITISTATTITQITGSNKLEGASSVPSKSKVEMIYPH